MVQIKEVSDNVFALELSVPVIQCSLSVYIIREAYSAVIDPGPSVVSLSLQEAMHKLGLKDIAYIIATHLHVDHAGGLGTLSNVFPGAHVLVHPIGVRHIIDPSRLIESTRKAWGDDFEHSIGPILPVQSSQVRAVKDGETVSLNGRKLEIIHAPGHAPHQMVVFDRTSGGIFCGDALGMLAKAPKPFPLPNTAPPNYDQELYLSTTSRLRSLGARTLFYAHGGAQPEAGALISMSIENTLDLGERVLESMRKHADKETIIGEIQKYIADRYALELDRADLEITVSGYMYYFTQKGIV